MKKHSKLLVIAMGALCAVGAAGCGQGGGGGGKGSITTIRILQDSGTGTKEQPTWIEQCAARFMEANKDKSFGSGKKGVNITFKAEKIDAGSYSSFGSSGYDIFIDENQFDVFKNKNLFMDISEVVNMYKDKIDERALYRTQAEIGSNEYYALPFYEWFPGISYDIDLFEERNYYFADSSVTEAVPYTCSFNNDYTFNFISSSSDKKSVGPDGQFGTSDDGLPSSIEEFVTLCDLMYSAGDSPIIMCGSGTQYSWYMVNGIWASLAGADAMETVYCNYKDGGTPLNVVTGFSDTEDLFFQGSGIKKPLVETINVTDENGYLCYSMVERYYALSLFQFLLKHGVNDESFINLADAYEAKEAQDSFIERDKGYGYGMLYDSSYWFHEDRKTIDDWNKQHAERKVAHMPLPTQFAGTVTEGNGKKNTLIDTGSTYIFVNRNTQRNPDRKNAAIEFLKFLYSDAEINDFTKVTGLTVPKNTGYSLDGADIYYKELDTFRKEANVIPYASKSERFIKNFSSFNLGYGSNLCSVNGNREGYLVNMRNNMSSQTIFSATCSNADKWNSMIK